MSLRKLSGSDADAEMLIELWRNEHVQRWNINFPKYSKAVERKAAQSRINHQMDGVDTCRSIKLNCSKLYAK